DSTDASRFVSMLEKEVLVAPFLEPGIERLVKLIASALESPVKMDGVLRVRVVGSQVGAASKPASRASFKVSEVRGHRRHKRLQRVQHKRHSGGEELDSVAYGEARGELFGKAAVHL